MNEQLVDRASNAGRVARRRRGNGRAMNRRLPSRITDIDDRQLTQMLGWMSIGVGIAEILAPRLLGRALGVGDHPSLFRVLGVRELVSGVGLLSQQRAGGWAWSRVAGDAMDLTLLGAATRSNEARPERIAAAATAVMGIAALDVYSSQKLMSSRLQTEPVRIEVTSTVAVNAQPDILYQFWSKLDNLPLFMRHLESVSVTGETSSHWVAKPIGDVTVEWDAEITESVESERLSWRTLPEAEVFHEGSVTFAPEPHGRGTIVRVALTYEPPAGEVGKAVATLLGSSPQQIIQQDLLRFKQLIETGEIATTAGQPHGKRSLLGRTTLGRRAS